MEYIDTTKIDSSLEWQSSNMPLSEKITWLKSVDNNIAPGNISNPKALLDSVIFVFNSLSDYSDEASGELRFNILRDYQLNSLASKLIETLSKEASLAEEKVFYMPLNEYADTLSSRADMILQGGYNSLKGESALLIDPAYHEGYGDLTDGDKDFYSEYPEALAALLIEEAMPSSPEKLSDLGIDTTQISGLIEAQRQFGEAHETPDRKSELLTNALYILDTVISSAPTHHHTMLAIAHKLYAQASFDLWESDTRSIGAKNSINRIQKALDQLETARRNITIAKNERPKVLGLDTVERKILYFKNEYEKILDGIAEAQKSLGRTASHPLSTAA